MSYRTFETKNANYVLGLMNHNFEKNLKDGLQNGGISRLSGLEISLFDSVDGLVIEEFGGGIGKTLQIYWGAAEKSLEGKHEDGEIVYAAGDPCHQIIVRNLMKVPIYSTDVNFGDTEEEDNRRVERSVNSRLDDGFRRWLEEDAHKELYSKSELSGVTQWLAQFCFYLEGDPIIEGRNAINAEKIERWVVPRVSEISGKEKPTIGLTYGAHHLGMEQNLKSPRRRRKVLKNMRGFNGYDARKFNLAQEARYNPDSRIVEVKEHDTGLF
ncbi:MAG: hypothetical protein Q8R47_00635 [Nanoarchaeota archaeon]|nr:hypothetical protein [Nanoarchaeota archaeon]